MVKETSGSTVCLIFYQEYTSRELRQRQTHKSYLSVWINDMFGKLFTLYIKPKLDYTSYVWSPHLKKSQRADLVGKKKSY